MSKKSASHQLLQCEMRGVLGKHSLAIKITVIIFILAYAKENWAELHNMEKLWKCGMPNPTCQCDLRIAAYKLNPCQTCQKQTSTAQVAFYRSQKPSSAQVHLDRFLYRSSYTLRIVWEFSGNFSPSMELSMRETANSQYKCWWTWNQWRTVPDKALWQATSNKFNFFIFENS